MKWDNAKRRPEEVNTRNTRIIIVTIIDDLRSIGEIPRVPFSMPGTRELADAVGLAAKDSPAVILQNHGLIVAGSSLRHAIDITLIIEQTAEKLITCYMLNKTPPVLPDEIVATLKNLGEMIA